VLLGVALLLTAGLAAFGLVGLNRSVARVVDQYGPARVEATALQVAYLNQETGVRGYVLTGQSAQLQPYVDGQTAEARSMARLSALVGGRQDLQRDLAAVRQAADSWRSSYAEPVIARVRAAGNRPDAALASGAGRLQFDRLRVTLTALQADLDRARAAAAAQLRRGIVLLDVLSAVAVAAAVLLAVGLWSALRSWVVDPLARLGAEARMVAGGDLAHRVAVTGPREVTVLAGEVEAMRTRIVDAYHGEAMARQASEDAAHQLEEQASELRRSNAELEQFAYVASHDLQEPLRKVASFCQMLERRYKGQLDERADQYIAFAVDGAKRMQRLINDLLAFSRVGRLTGEFRDVALDEVLAAALSSTEPLREETGATVTSDPLPIVPGDPGLLTQLLQNLLVNAVKFRREGVPPAVHVSARRIDGEWQLCCSDNGIGIEPQYGERVFVIFQRLHAKDAYEGTGIGLALCKKIVEHHGGRIWIDPDRTDGATVCWTLPAVTAPTEDGVAAGDPAAMEREKV